MILFFLYTGVSAVIVDAFKIFRLDTIPCEIIVFV